MSEVKLLQGDCIELMKNITDESIKKLYIEERYSLRKIAKILNTDHHTIKRKLQNMGVPLNNKNRKREPFSKEHRYKISESKKGCQSWCKGKKMPYIAILKNMITHIKWNVDLDFYLQFNNIEKLKALNNPFSLSISPVIFLFFSLLDIIVISPRLQIMIIYHCGTYEP